MPHFDAEPAEVEKAVHEKREGDERAREHDVSRRSQAGLLAQVKSRSA
jgi:hypothetical protein